MWAGLSGEARGAHAFWELYSRVRHFFYIVSILGHFVEHQRFRLYGSGVYGIKSRIYGLQHWVEIEVVFDNTQFKALN